MAERRRIIPASVGPDFYGTQEQPDRPTRRLTVTLPESSDKTSPEFSYIDLVKESGGTVEEEKSFNDIDEDDLTGLAALARKFEEKYGAAKGKKKRKRLEDVMDVGLGYDESDPFVDNSECYDELVPSVLTTRFGGFYINSGELHFKEISGDSDDSDFQVQKRKKKTQKRKKRKALDSDDDKQIKSKKRQLSGSSDTPKKKIKKKLHRQFSSGIDEKKKKKKKLNLPKAPTIAELLKTKKDLSSETTKSTGPQNSNGPGILNGPDISQVPVSGGGAHPLENIDPSLDLGMAHLPMDSDMAAILNDTLAGMGDGDDLADVDMLGLQANGEQEEEEVKMPLDIPSQLEKDVNKIKEAARKSMEGKCKFFTPTVNSLLLDIENQTRNLTCGKRSTIYNHLAYHLPCSKDTLLKRAKKLRLGAQDSQLKEPIINLKEAISEVMPAQIERYQEECIAAEQAKQERIEEEEKNDKNASQDEDEEKSRGPKSQAPRKKFFWTDHLRNLLCHVVSIKLKTYEMSKTRSQSAEDYLKAFLDAEIKPLWPPGWMQTRMLFKESRSVHSPITSMPPKQKKLIPPLKKSQPKKVDINSSQTSLLASASKEPSPDSQRDHSRNISPYSGDSVSPSRVTKPPGEGLTILDYAENSNDMENVEKELPQESDGGTLSLLASAMSEVVKELEKEKTAGHLKDSVSRNETEEPKHYSATRSETIDTMDKPDRCLPLSPQDDACKSGMSSQSLKQLVSPSVLVKKSSSNNKEQGSLQSPPRVSPMHSPTASPLSMDSFSQPTVRLMRQPVLDKISTLHPDSRVIVKTLPPLTTSDSKTHVSRKESHSSSSASHLKRSSPSLAGAHSSKVPPVSPLSNYSKTPSPSTSPSGQEGIRSQTIYTKHHPLSERLPHQLSSHSPKIPSSAHSPNSLQYKVTSTTHRVSPSRMSPGMTPNSMSFPASHVGSGFGIASQQSSLSSVQRPNPVKLSSNIPRRGSFPSMLNQVVSSPLTSPTLTSEDVPHPHSRGFQQITLSDLTRKVSSSHSSASYPRLSTSGMMGRSASVDQVSPTLEGGGMRPSLIPGMGYMPGQNRDPNYDNTTQGQPRLL